MDSIAAALVTQYPNQTIDELINAVYDYIAATYLSSPSALEEQSLKSIIATILNGYLNMQSGEYLRYNALQMDYITQLIDGTLACGNPEDIQQHILNIEESLTASRLSPAEQQPILYATAIGKSTYGYWADVIGDINAGTPTNWQNFVVSFTPAINKFPSWLAASMQGVLIALNIPYTRLGGDFAETDISTLDYKGGNVVLSVGGALAVGAGKVIFNLQPREIVQSFALDMDMDGGINYMPTKDCGCHS